MESSTQDPQSCYFVLKRVLHSQLLQPVSCTLSLSAAACLPGPAAGEYFSYPLQTVGSENQVSLGRWVKVMLVEKTEDVRYLVSELLQPAFILANAFQ